MTRALPLLLASCVWTGPADPGVERGFSDGLRGRLPLCVPAELLGAAGVWERAAGRVVADCLPAGGYPVDVSLREGEPEAVERDAVASARRESDGAGVVTACEVVVAPGWSTPTTLAHEVGHCLGLADDERTGLLMDRGAPPGAEPSALDAELVGGLP